MNVWKRANPSHANRKQRDFWELAIGYGLILSVIWTANPWQRSLYFIALGWILLVTALAPDSRQTMGLQTSGFVQSLWVAGLAVLIMAGAVVVAIKFRTLHYPHGIVAFFRRFAGYILWAFMQQFLLQDFVLLRLLRILPKKKVAVVAAAGLFAAAHLPSPILTACTLLWGLVACTVFLRYRNIFSLAIAHAILGICLVISIPGYVHHNMRVGHGYLIYHSNGPVLPQP